MSDKLQFDDYFMLQAILIRSRASCDRASVGSVLVRDKRIISTGYNGSVSGQEHCSGEHGVGHHLIDGHCVRTVHSEINAISQCAKYGISTNGASLYVTHFPCLNCTKSIIQAGISKVIYLNDYRVDSFALELLNNSGIILEKHNLNISNEQILDIINLNW